MFVTIFSETCLAYAPAMVDSVPVVSLSNEMGVAVPRGNGDLPLGIL